MGDNGETRLACTREYIRQGREDWLCNCIMRPRTIWSLGSIIFTARLSARYSEHRCPFSSVELMPWLARQALCAIQKTSIFSRDLGIVSVSSRSSRILATELRLQIHVGSPKPTRGKTLLT